MLESTKKPGFFIVGAPKCGTTSFYHYLRQHPQIFMPDNKEPHYFGSDLKKRSDEFIKTEEEYLSLFKDADSSQMAGEASTFYLYSKAAQKEIKGFNPHAKIIIMLRNPIDFLHSLRISFVFSYATVLSVVFTTLFNKKAQKLLRFLFARKLLSKLIASGF